MCFNYDINSASIAGSWISFHSMFLSGQLPAARVSENLNFGLVCSEASNSEFTSVCVAILKMFNFMYDERHGYSPSGGISDCVSTLGTRRSLKSETEL
ncbi:hypothetical protein CEXT_355631 [Caerostris extrusa]|uniref:Uncharacterized protein n=1 Tax=Caerostris extrusa TaxID=172846 RepID=A0AAV4SLA7_CAEEX|nr:hypothetical protein CEXT_355631 [Caerostris extrusa]